MTEKEALIRWLEIREENGIPFPNNLFTLQIALGHSDLYPRLIGGSRIYPFAPPLSRSHPNYRLLDEGSYVSNEVWFPGTHGFEGKVAASVYPGAMVVIIDDFAWKVHDIIEPNEEYLITYNKYEFEDIGFKLSKLDGNRCWLLEKVNII